MRVHASSAGLDPTSLRPGSDLVLDIDPAHGELLADGVLADDHLDDDARLEIHRAGLPALERWREQLDATLTVRGLSLPWLWELPIERGLVSMLGHAEGLRRAVERHGARELVLVGPDERTRRVGAAVATAAAIGLSERPPAAGPAPAAARPAAIVRRRRLMASLRRLGIPSRLRPGSVLFVSYWPMMALLDRMLADPRRRPALLAQRPPAGPVRSLRSGLRGGWVGTPGVAARHRAARTSARALAAAAAAAPVRLESFGLELGAAAHCEVLAVARLRAADDLATAATLRRAFARARPAAVLSAWDADPLGRMVTHLAQQAGIRTLVLSHGAYLLPQTLVDMDLCDEPLLWSRATAPPITEAGRRVHVVGYPLPTAPAPPTRPAPPAGSRPRVLVLAQPDLRGTGLTSPRITMRQYATAVAALLDRRPDARIVLRPHPTGDPRTEAALAARFPGASIEVDRTSAIADAHAGCELCIGTITTATLQAALVGTPVIALNLMGFDWAWPLGGDTTVPVARSDRELAGWLDRWSAGPALPGREDLLSALGAPAGGGDPTDRLLAILDDAPPAG